MVIPFGETIRSRSLSLRDPLRTPKHRRSHRVFPETAVPLVLLRTEESVLPSKTKYITGAEERAHEE